MPTITLEWLRSLDALRTVPEKQLQWFLDNSEHRTIEEGEYLFKSGERILGTSIIFSGRVRIFVTNGDSSREVGYFEEKEITGYLPFSRGLVASVSGEAVSQLQFLFFPIEKMNDLILGNFELTQALVHVMTTRVREFTVRQQQNEKMMALGKLSAGVAHELNNPSSAILRASSTLKTQLRMQCGGINELLHLQLSAEQGETINRILQKILDRFIEARSLTERQDWENLLTDWMDQRKIDNSVELAETFADYGVLIQDLDELEAALPPKVLSAALSWISKTLVAEKIVDDIREASQRISDLVGAIKNFTHMDRGNSPSVFDIHMGINNTLTILEHKIKKNNVKLIKEFDPELPPVHGYPGELNQVWTNLIDNALDAMEATNSGILKITSSKENHYARVAIADNGPGIPEDLRTRIFEPFFTTKEMGKGTGLGLDVVSRIVNQHRGTINVKSVPGCTEFVVCFPTDS